MSEQERYVGLPISLLDGQLEIVPEIEVVSEPRPVGPDITLTIEAHGRELSFDVAPGIEPGQMAAINETMSKAALAMSYVPSSQEAHDWLMYDQAITEIAAMWGLARDVAREAFEAWVRGTIYSWPQAYWLIKAGNREALEALDRKD